MKESCECVCGDVLCSVNIPSKAELRALTLS